MATAQVQVTGTLDNGVIYGGWARQIPTQRIDPSLDESIRSFIDYFHRRGGLSAEVFDRGFSVHGYGEGPAYYVFTPGGFGSFRFRMQANRRVTGTLHVVMDAPFHEHSDGYMIESVLRVDVLGQWEREFSSGTPINVAIPVELEFFGAIEFELSFAVSPVRTASTDGDVRVVFIPDSPPIQMNGCTLQPYGVSCAELTGVVPPFGRFASLRVFGHPNTFGRIDLGHRKQFVPMPTAGCLQLLLPSRVLSTPWFTMNARGEATAMIPLPPRGSSVLVQGSIGSARGGIRTTNGLEIICH